MGIRLGRGRGPRSRTPIAAAVAGVLVIFAGAEPALASSAAPASATTASAAATSAAIPQWQKYEPDSYDPSPAPPGHEGRVATPQDSALNRLSGDIVMSWWLLKNPAQPRESLFLVELEPYWQTRQVGQSGTLDWTVLDETNASTPQFPFLNGIFSLKRGVPLAGMTPSIARIDADPGLRSQNLDYDYSGSSNTWRVRGTSPLATVNFTVDHPVPGGFASYYPPDGKTVGPTNVDAVSNGHVTGSLTFNGRRIDLDGWRTEYWRANMFPSVYDSQLNPATSWRGWEWDDVMEPDGGASQFGGVIDPDGEYHGYLVDARPSGTRICSGTTVQFGDYHYGTPLAGDISPPFQRYTIPGWIKVTCAPGQPVRMTKTFYPDSTDYVDAGLVDGTEMPVHTVPGSMGTYEHWRYTTYRVQKYEEGTGT